MKQVIGKFEMKAVCNDSNLFGQSVNIDIKFEGIECQWTVFELVQFMTCRMDLFVRLMKGFLKFVSEAKDMVPGILAAIVTAKKEINSLKTEEKESYTLYINRVNKIVNILKKKNVFMIENNIEGRMIRIKNKNDEIILSIFINENYTMVDNITIPNEDILEYLTNLEL